MPRYLRVLESQSTVLPITAGEAQALERAGRRLASDREWLHHDDVRSNGTVISCTPGTDEGWSVTVRNALGVVVVKPDLQITVSPKIPMAHFLYLAELAEFVPRLDSQRGTVGRSDSLWQLVARWLIDAVQALLRRDLLRDYQEERDETAVVRGSLQPLETSRIFYGGRLNMLCVFDEFGLNTPLNRVLRAAMEIVARSPNLCGILRASARRVWTPPKMQAFF